MEMVGVLQFLHCLYFSLFDILFYLVLLYGAIFLFSGNIDPELQEIHASQYKLSKSLVDVCICIYLFLILFVFFLIAVFILNLVFNHFFQVSSDVPEGSGKMKYKG